MKITVIIEDDGRTYEAMNSFPSSEEPEDLMEIVEETCSLAFQRYTHDRLENIHNDPGGERDPVSVRG